MTTTLEGQRILIIEDESMICMLVEDMLTDLGCRVAGTAARLDEAIDKVASLAFDAAILDVNLNGSQTYRIARALMEKAIPFVMATGYGAAGVPDDFRDVPVLGKPFDRNDLEKALRTALGCA